MIILENAKDFKTWGEFNSLGHLLIFCRSFNPGLLAITYLIQQTVTSEQFRSGRHLNPQTFMTIVSYLLYLVVLENNRLHYLLKQLLPNF